MINFLKYVYLFIEEYFEKKRPNQNVSDFSAFLWRQHLLLNFFTLVVFVLIVLFLILNNDTLIQLSRISSIYVAIGLTSFFIVAYIFIFKPLSDSKQFNTGLDVNKLNDPKLRRQIKVYLIMSWVSFPMILFLFILLAYLFS